MNGFSAAREGLRTIHAPTEIGKCLNGMPAPSGFDANLDAEEIMRWEDDGGLVTSDHCHSYQSTLHLISGVVTSTLSMAMEDTLRPLKEEEV